MSEQAAIETPFTLASLPKPFDTAKGHTLAAPVYGLRGQKWRKRPEVAVSVDGDSICIYNVRTPRLVTSYALPPQTRILCAPCSSYRKPAGRKAQRITYAVAGTENSKALEVLCFVEEALSESSELSADHQQKTTYQLGKQSSPVVALHALATHSDHEDTAAALDVLVIFEDGSVQCIAGDLTTKLWDADSTQAMTLSQGAASESEGFGSVQYATLTDVNAARKGLLRGREDALALIDHASSTFSEDATEFNTPLLALVTGRTFHLFALPSRSKDLVSSSHQGLRHVLSYQLPATAAAAAGASSDATFTLQASAGRLYELNSGLVITHDLTGITPRVLSTLHPRGRGYTSFVRLSPALVLASGPERCGIYDTKYSSLQGSLCIARQEPVDTKSGKRKRDHDGAHDPEKMHFVAFFADLGLAVALAGTSLLGLQVNLSAPTHKKNKAAPSLLINSIGKGSRTAARPAEVGESLGSDEEEWGKWREAVDGLIAESDFQGLEEFLGADLEGRTVKVKSKKNITRQGLAKQNLAKRGKHQKDRDDGVKESEGLKDSLEEEDNSKNNGTVDKDNSKTDGTVDKDNTEQAKQSRTLADTPVLLQKTDRRKALYILSNMFAYTSAADTQQLSLSVTFFAPTVFKWLALTGYITSAMISLALNTFSTGPAPAPVQPGEITRALNNLDPAMHILHEWLSWPVYIDLEDIVVSLKTLISSLLGPSTPAAINKLIANSSAAAAATATLALTNGDEASQESLDSAIEIEEEAAEADLQHALSSLEDGISVRSANLRLIFTRLYAVPSAALVAAMAAHLSQREVVFFIQILRLELAEGGWTSRYLDRAPELLSGDATVDDEDDLTDPSDHAIGIISKLLNDAIDAVGVSGWLVNLAGDADLATDDMLAILRAETSAALEGCHEAASMGSFLDDFERFAAQHWDSHGRSERREREKTKVDPIRAPGFEAPPASALDPVLPMGMKVEKREKMLIRSGGREQKKSKGLLGKERSMAVGKYSLDRIVV